MSQETINKIVKLFFSVQLHVKLYHWNTTSYARHKATDQFLEKFSDNIDKFVEVFIGRFIIKPNIEGIKIEQTFLTDSGIVNLLNSAKEALEGLDNIIKASDLINIRDEIIADINQTLYLLRLD